MNPKRLLSTLAAFTALAIASGAACAQAAYPCPAVKLVSPYPPGGTTDLLARLIQPGLMKELGTPVIVENKAGASSNIGIEFVATAAPDGCTLLLGSNTGIVINRNLYKLRVDPVKGLAPIGQVASVPLVLYVSAGVPATSLAQLVELAKKNPGKLSYASAGSGSPQHLMGELLKLEQKISLAHIPYKGSGPAIQDVVAGQVEMSFEAMSVIVPQLASGRIRALATTGAARSAGLPNVPTMKEQGMPGFVTENWYGLFAPAGTPAALVKRLNGALNTVLDSKEARISLDKMGSADVKGTPEAFAKFIASELPLWESVVKRSGAKVD
ncbi:tripartite tricarboxylate transporter substrate binding protein [Polaromonas sp. JS666]|uniref:Bug family tripartite tricarboxylate transporter substrate binding protein n=1 Tax=Polaromonas sp. (strain JS666 / ATCC BAA-500) TaxID=296591 RepID=UPI00088CE1E2|nr:tripartite tricarboxylate transporter substrate binding protein [Polaromonas sp. JS666]SDM43827.1 Tripartite-type tricarboxylate transporter, receptor component TctC [Polaromonas sp. JS666]